MKVQGNRNCHRWATAMQGIQRARAFKQNDPTPAPCVKQPHGGAVIHAQGQIPAWLPCTANDGRGLQKGFGFWELCRGEQNNSPPELRAGWCLPTAVGVCYDYVTGRQVAARSTANNAHASDR